jgi:hypothetical protein
MAKDGIIKAVGDALEKGFASKGARVYFVTEKSDYRDFIRMFVVSDFFRNKTDKERLGDVFSILEENGARNAISKISLCVAMTRREYDREFGKYTWLGAVRDVYGNMKRKPRISRLASVRSKG